MACQNALCPGQELNHCPVCGNLNAPTYPSWEERLENRRHQGSHQTVQVDVAPKPVKQGSYSIDNGGFRPGPRYSRAFNSKYDGPGKGSW